MCLAQTSHNMSSFSVQLARVPSGYGAYQTQELCCTPGLAFPDGCSQRPSECWVVESYNLRTCIRDDRKCLQGECSMPLDSPICGKDVHAAYCPALQ